MSVKELSALLVSEGFHIVGNSSWEKGKVSISLDMGFLYVVHSGVGTLGFPFSKYDNFYITVFREKLIIWWGDMVYTHKI